MTHVPGLRLTVALASAGLVATGCTSATGVTRSSPGEAVTQQADEMVGIDLRRVDGVHRGRLVGLDEVEALNRRGLAMFAIADAPDLRPDDAAAATQPSSW